MTLRMARILAPIHRARFRLGGGDSRLEHEELPDGDRTRLPVLSWVPGRGGPGPFSRRDSCKLGDGI